MLGDNGDILLIGTIGRLTVQLVGMAEGTAVDLITTTDVLETTGGADTMSGNAKADVMLGGVNDGGVDTLYGDRAPARRSLDIANDGDDILLGDNGLLDFTLGADTDRNTLDLIRSFEDGRGGDRRALGNGRSRTWRSAGPAGDTIYGDDAGFNAEARIASDMLLGDNADIFLVDEGPASGRDLKLVLDCGGQTPATTDEETPEYGGSTRSPATRAATSSPVACRAICSTAIAPVPTPATIAISTATTSCWATTAAGVAVHGRLSETRRDSTFRLRTTRLCSRNVHEAGPIADTDLTTLDLITTEQPTSGGRDLIFGDEGKDLMFGGTDADTCYGDDGDETRRQRTNHDVMFGDHGRLYPQFSTPCRTSTRATSSPSTSATSDGGEGDRMWGEEGDDVMLGQQGDDRMWGGSGDDDMIGGHNVTGGYDELTGRGHRRDAEPAGQRPDGRRHRRRRDGRRQRHHLAPRRRHQPAVPGPHRRRPSTRRRTTKITANVGAAVAERPGRRGRPRHPACSTTPTPCRRPRWAGSAHDVMAGGADSDVMFGELGDDLMQGDGIIGADDNDAAHRHPRDRRDRFRVATRTPTGRCTSTSRRRRPTATTTSRATAATT